jgi:hypothetical protein
MFLVSNLRHFFRPSVALSSRKLMTTDKFKYKRCLKRKTFTELVWFWEFPFMLRNSKKARVEQLLGRMVLPSFLFSYFCKF